MCTGNVFLSPDFGLRPVTRMRAMTSNQSTPRWETRRRHRQVKPTNHVGTMRIGLREDFPWTLVARQACDVGLALASVHFLSWRLTHTYSDTAVGVPPPLWSCHCYMGYFPVTLDLSQWPHSRFDVIIAFISLAAIGTFPILVRYMRTLSHIMLLYSFTLPLGRTPFRDV